MGKVWQGEEIMRSTFIIAALIAASGCSEQPAPKTAADLLIEQGQRQMKPVHDEIQTAERFARNDQVRVLHPARMHCINKQLYKV